MRVFHIIFVASLAWNCDFIAIFPGQSLSDASLVPAGRLDGHAAAGEAEAGVSRGHPRAPRRGRLDLDEPPFQPDADAVGRRDERTEGEAAETGESLRFWRHFQEECTGAVWAGQDELMVPAGRRRRCL